MTNEKKLGPISFAEHEQRVLVAFGDVRGFRSWMKRSGPSQFKKSYKHLQEQWARFATRASLYKSLGDGFMAVWDLRPSHNCRLMIDLAKISVETAEAIETIRMGIPEPRFSGWRIRWVGGDAFKLFQSIGRRRQLEYVSPRINLCKDLLYVAPEDPVVLHESAWELCSDEQFEKENLSLTPVPYQRHPALSIFDEDLRTLKTLGRLSK